VKCQKYIFIPFTVSARLAYTKAGIDFIYKVGSV